MDAKISAQTLQQSSQSEGQTGDASSRLPNRFPEQQIICRASIPGAHLRAQR
jgi:hypothetical protein